MLAVLLALRLDRAVERGRAVVVAFGYGKIVDWGFGVGGDRHGGFGDVGECGRLRNG